MESVMKRTTATSFLSTCAISLALFSSCTSVEPNTLTPEEIADGWQLLFDGKTLNGWKDYNGTTLTQPWHVVDGCIQAKGDGSDASGYIVTDKQYENFELSWDWKLSKGGNSGMLYHVVERPQFAVPYVTGPEYQLIDEPNFPEPLEEWQKLGVDYAMHLPDKAKMKVNPQGEWNNSKIVFDNGHVEHWLNGVKILEFEAWTDDWYAKKNSGKWANAPEYGLAKKGVLCLQDHGYPASFRNIKIKELPRKTKEVTLFNGTDLKGWEAYGTEKWYVEDGLLICESGPDKKYGYLATRDYYDDFDLTVEFKQEADGNSGVFIRSFIEEDVKVNGWQVEVAPKGHDTGGIYESYGRGWLIQIPDEKENILKEGKLLSPLIVWGNTLVDGHNRYAILQKHPEICFSTMPLRFANREEALAWICKNQLGRRNLSPEQKRYLLGKQYESEKKAEKIFHGNQYTLAKKSGGSHDDTHHSGKKTCERIAEENGVSRASVLRARHYTKGIDIADTLSPGIKKKVFSGEVKFTNDEMIKLVQSSPDKRQDVFAEIMHPEITKAMEAADAEPNADTPVPMPTADPEQFKTYQVPNEFMRVYKTLSTATEMMKNTWKRVLKNNQSYLSDPEKQKVLRFAMQRPALYLNELEACMEQILAETLEEAEKTA